MHLLFAICGSTSRGGLPELDTLLTFNISLAALVCLFHSLATTMTASNNSGPRVRHPNKGYDSKTALNKDYGNASPTHEQLRSLQLLAHLQTVRAAQTPQTPKPRLLRWRRFLAALAVTVRPRTSDARLGRVGILERGQQLVQIFFSEQLRDLLIARTQGAGDGDPTVGVARVLQSRVWGLDKGFLIRRALACCRILRMLKEKVGFQLSFRQKSALGFESKKTPSESKATN
jgi:hypothetical protein